MIELLSRPEKPLKVNDLLVKSFQEIIVSLLKEYMFFISRYTKNKEF